ncbi:NUDIX hydrolase [Pseudomonas aeruginosa]|nr:NUDIX hydrolase [Pseudomonas aeruginosa]
MSVPQLLGAGIPAVRRRPRAAPATAGTAQLPQRHRADALPGDHRGRSGMTDTLLSISAACLFDDQGNLLLVRKRGTQAFMLPGGKREPGETRWPRCNANCWRSLRLPMGASTFEHLGNFQAPAANEANTRVDADIYVARLPHAVCPGRAGRAGLAAARPAATGQPRATAARPCPAAWPRRAAERGKRRRNSVPARPRALERNLPSPRARPRRMPFSRPAPNHDVGCITAPRLSAARDSADNAVALSATEPGQAFLQ